MIWIDSTCSRFQIGSNRRSRTAGHDVLHRLLPQEMVDPEEALLREDRGQLPVQLAAEARSVPNGFSTTSRSRRRRGRRCDLLGDLVEHRRRRRKVEDRQLAPSSSARSRRTSCPPRRRRRRTAGGRGDRQHLVVYASSAAATASVDVLLELVVGARGRRRRSDTRAAPARRGCRARGSCSGARGRRDPEDASASAAPLTMRAASERRSGACGRRARGRRPGSARSPSG